MDDARCEAVSASRRQRPDAAGARQVAEATVHPAQITSDPRLAVTVLRGQPA